MKNNTDPSFFAELVDPRIEARTLALYCVRPDLLNGITLEQIGESSGLIRQRVYKLATDFRETTGLRS